MLPVSLLPSDAPTTREALERIPTPQLDRWAFGVSEGDEITVEPADVVPDLADLSNAEIEYEQGLVRRHGEYVAKVPPRSWARHVYGKNKKDPIEIRLRGGRFQIDDGHHRYVAARALGAPLRAIVSRIDDNPIEEVMKLQRARTSRSTKGSFFFGSKRRFKPDVILVGRTPRHEDALSREVERAFEKERPSSSIARTESVFVADVADRDHLEKAGALSVAHVYEVEPLARARRARRRLVVGGRLHGARDRRAIAVRRLGRGPFVLRRSSERAPDLGIPRPERPHRP